MMEVHGMKKQYKQQVQSPIHPGLLKEMEEWL